MQKDQPIQTESNPWFAETNLHWEREDRLLKKYDIEYFKAHELERGIGQFAKYRDDPSHPHQKFSKREKEFFTEIKTESIDITLEFGQIHGIGAVLLLPDYEQLKREYDEIGKLLPSPYFLCAQFVMMEAGFIMNAINATLEPYRQGVMLPVFDEQDEYSGRAKEMFESFAQKNPQCSGHLSPPDYENDKQYLMLQAADNLAYEVRRLPSASRARCYRSRLVTGLTNEQLELDCQSDEALD